MYRQVLFSSLSAYDQKFQQATFAFHRAWQLSRHQKFFVNLRWRRVQFGIRRIEVRIGVIFDNIVALVFVDTLIAGFRYLREKIYFIGDQRGLFFFLSFFHCLTAAWTCRAD